MKIAVSNIAWPAENDAEAYATLQAHGISALEVAPSRRWPHWKGIGEASIAEYRQTLAGEGLSVFSLQAILFQQPDLRLFGTDADRAALDRHLRFCADLAVGLGASCAVFGAPKNRDKGSLTLDEAFDIAVPFFTSVGEHFASQGVFIGFEANPVDYGCNFGTHARDAARLVRAVASPGFRLHLDTACMHLAGEAAAELITENADILGHFHASQPHLGTFADPLASHQPAAAALSAIGYKGWCVLEMRAAEPPIPALDQAVSHLRSTYGDRS